MTRVCPNEECGKYSLEVSLHDWRRNIKGSSTREKDHHERWTLLPPAQMMNFPDYVPEVIITDYKEACLIRDFSPKASATLSRRCLQGMIRDFWGINKSRLVDEIKELEDKVDKSTWEAIDAMRKVGNIGAHMEKDINTLVEVDPNEAQLLIGLLETLIQDWYIAKHNREERLRAITEMAAQKDDVKKNVGNNSTEP